MSWWHSAVGYQIYVRSFADSDGDGLGDLPGIRTRLAYLADLGVDVIWLTPFYPSPQADHGYDVADYRDVDPRFGTLTDLDALVDDAHRHGLKVVIDLVPNHTSDTHPWFVESRASREARHRDWYVWRDPAPDGGPPNNWVSHFGGPAWTFDATTGQYYMHLFLPEQPDLNWANDEVREEFERIIDFWLRRGVDGLRVDVAHSLAEDPVFRDNPSRTGSGPATSPQEVFDSFVHVHDLNQPEVQTIYRRWREVASRHDALLIGEVYLLEPVELARYVAGDGLHTAFCFPALKVGWSASEIQGTLRDHIATSGSALAWPLSSHDDPRAASRFGGGRLGARRALAYLTLLCGLPGMPWILQGDELGLDDAQFGDSTAEDPIAVRNPGSTGRDGMRAPMLWDTGAGFGFTAGEPWLPFGTNRSREHTVEAQLADPSSQLHATRQLFAARRSLPALNGDTSFEWLTDGGDVIACRRDGSVVVALNVASSNRDLEIGGDLDVVFATRQPTTIGQGTLSLPPDAAAILAPVDPPPQVRPSE